MEFLIVATGYNCQQKVRACINSVKRIRDRNFRAVFISDGSNDSTGLFLDQERSVKPIDDRLIFESYSDNQGAARRRFTAIKKYANTEDTIIILLGLDDELKPQCINRITEKYNRGAWCTYGNWEDQMKEMLPDGFIDFSEHEHVTRSYRTVKYRSTAPNTFKRFLFDQMNEDDFKYKGEWIKATTESNLMLSCLEMSGKDRIGVIKDSIYIYNKGRLDNARRRFGSQYQDQIYRDVVSKVKRNLLIRP